jgi:3-hydroxyacyl-[acyl-carrier-protein] dehydratase|tara:strand:+ start:1910 stop:2749 length:840 start_codon:yes stop_codon:yes gene_type:complete
MPASEDTQQIEEEIRDTMKRCSDVSVKAAIQYSQKKDADLVPVIVIGIIERFVEPGLRGQVKELGKQARLTEDLGVDSLLMVEIVMTVEAVLDIAIENDELKGLRTLGDIESFVAAKLKGEPSPHVNKVFGPEQIAATMPHKPPFLFLHEVRVNGSSAEGTYTIPHDDLFMEAHFPGDPIFPASLMIEALGQLAVFSILRSDRPEFAAGSPERVLFVSSDGVRCHRICRPGETLNLKVEFSRARLPIAQFSGSITCAGSRVAVVEELSLGVYGSEGEEA